MTLRKLQVGELIALPRSSEVRAGAAAGDLSRADLSNVVLFTRGRAGRQAPEVAAPSDARPATKNRATDRARLLAFAALSLALHAGLFVALWREPAPLASVGEQVISLEIVIGATAPAGPAQTPGEQEVQSAAPTPQQPDQQQASEERATEQPQTVQVASEETAPEQSAKPDAAAPEETPREAPPQTEIALVPPPEERPTPPKAQPKSVQHAVPAKESRRIDAPTRAHAAARHANVAPSTAANNVGVGRSDADSNYAGLVSAHLRRHQQYPADARSRGEQGVATVSFSLDGGGRVTAARLVRGSGIASIDQEVQAMVRRASPFPAPPSGRAVSFTVPVRFRLN